MMNIWERMDLFGAPKEFTTLLIQNTKQIFAYELSSPVYLSAAVLRVHTLKHWIGREYSATFMRKSIESLKKICLSFVFGN